MQPYVKYISVFLAVFLEGPFFLSRRVQEVTKMHSQGKGIHYFLTKCLDASKKCHYKGDKKHFPELQDSRVSILKLVPGAECDLA